MAATQAETQRAETNVEQNPSDQHAEARGLLQNGTDKAVGRVQPDGVNTKSKSPMSAEPGPPRDGAEAPGHDRPLHEQYGGYRYPEGVDPYYGQRPGFPGKPRPQGPPQQQQQQRFFPGQGPPQAPGPTPTLNSLLQSSGAPPQRYPNSYEQPPAGYGPAPGWPPPRPMPPYNPQAPYRNSAPPRPAGPGYGGAPYGPGPPPGGQPPPAGYGPPGSYPQRYPPPGPPGAPNSRPPYSPHQGYERAGSPQPPHPSGAPSPGLGQLPGALSPNQDSQHPPHPAQHPGHPQQQHQGYPPPPRPAQPSTPNAHDPDTDLAGQNSNDSGGSGGAGRASTPHLRPTPSPTGSGGSRSMSPAVGTQNVPMPPRPSSSLSDGSGPVTRAPGPGPGGPPPGAMLPQPYPHHGYKQHYPPQPYGYPPRGQHPPYPYGGYRHPPPPQHYPPMKGGNVRHMGGPGPGPGPGDGAMPPPTAPGAPEAHDNGPSAPATALVTTGPDGAPLDEGSSQQSTLSNASAASGEEGSGGGGGGKSRKESYGGGGSAAPSPSPGGGSHSAHDDYEGSPSPSPWPRPPSSPVFNSHIPPESFRSKKSDSLGKLYEMDETPERRSWVERLLAFMEERRTPIAACPTISKQPLDLYRLYLLVRDRGGFVEVTKNKTWKDIAGLLGIGASSSAAYTLRKHYTKNLLAYECHFDRGGIDPQPIINQVEASTKKKGGKNNSNTSAPANVQESFPGPGAGAPGPPMDGYGGAYTGYPPQPNQSQGAAGGDNLAASNPFEEHPGPRRPQGYQQGYGYEYGSPYPSNRPVYPPYGPEGDRGYGGPGGAGGGGGAGPGAPGGPPSGEYRYGSAGPYSAGAYRPPPAPAAPPAPAPPAPAGTPPPQPYPDYYRPPHQPHQPHQPPHQPHQTHQPHPPHQPHQAHQAQHANHQPPPGEIGGAATSQSSLMSSQLARQLVAPLPSAGKPYHYGGGKGAAGPPGGPGAPPPGAPAGPRRHPDFAGPPPGAGVAPPGAPPAPRGPFPPGWAGTFGGRGAAQGPAPPQPWRPPPPAAPPHQPPWPSHPYQHHPPHQAHQAHQAPHQPGQPGAWSGPAGPRPAMDQYPPAAQPSPGVSDRVIGTGQVKRELTFPPDSVEATTPSAEKRRRLTKADVAPVDAWRIVMALKSGLLAETCWALDVLNILLFDDACVGYFGLQHMPGLLDLLLEHFHKSISDVFDSPQPEDRAWFLPPVTSDPVPVEKEPQPRPPPPPHERTKLLDGENFTLESRRRLPVVYREEELFSEECEIECALRPEDDAREPWQLCDALPLPAFPPRAHVPAVRLMSPAPSPAPAPAAPARAPAAPSPTPPRSPHPAHPPPPPPRDPDADDLNAAPMELEGGAKLEIRDPAAVLKRRRLTDLEEECYSRDEPPLNLVPETRDQLARRCLALSNILRSLTFVPGNEVEFSRSGAFLALAGRLLLLHHEHAPKADRLYAKGRSETDPVTVEPAPLTDPEWWWDTLEQLREDALVACANIAGGVELQNQSEAVARPLLDGLLHWAVCGAAVAGDAPAHAPPSSPLSPRRLALEALCKLCVCEGNVDLVLATPPRERIGALCEGLARDLCRAERPVVREFAVVLLHAVAGAGLGAAREVALHAPAVPQLVAFIERAEQAALGVANQHGVAALRDNPDAMGTSLDMLRRAAATLARLARHPDNHALLRRHERRLLSLVMSQILDQKVAHELADVLYRCSKPTSAATDLVESEIDPR